MTTSFPEPLWKHISQARWFAGKGRGARPLGLYHLDWFVRREDLAVRASVAEIGFPDGSRERYQILLSHRADRGEGFLHTTVPEDGAGVVDGVTAGLPHVHDALKDPEALQALVDRFGSPAETPTWMTTVVRPVDLSGDIKVFGGEQSNTSVMVGDVAMLKFFRRLEPGANLDIAVHDALARAGVGSVAALYGWASGTLEGEQMDLAMLVEQLPGAHDGWDVATRAATSGEDFTRAAADLGRALAEIHRALSDTFPTTVLSSEELSGIMVNRLEAAAREASALEPLVPALAERFRRLAGQKVGAQRVHGDFHLGQTLLTDEGWRIIDFEGEPLKTLAERSEPDSRWRDVAGMLRSLAYATSACDDPRGEQARAWQQATQRAFLDAYLGQSSTRHLGPEDRALLDAYVADKAIYEVVYENRNRPTWVDIPLQALQSLVADNNEENRT